MKKLLPALLGTTLLLSGLVFVQGQQPAAAGAARPGSAPETKAPDFSLKRVPDGKDLSLADYKGKVRIVDFWATWCPPCRKEIPDFIELQKEYGSKGLVVIGVAMDKQGASVVAPFMKEFGINYPVVIGDEKASQVFGNIQAYPTTFLVDREGNVVKKYIGFQSKETFEKDLKALL